MEPALLFTLPVSHDFSVFCWGKACLGLKHFGKIAQAGKRQLLSNTFHLVVGIKEVELGRTYLFLHQALYWAYSKPAVIQAAEMIFAHIDKGR